MKKTCNAGIRDVNADNLAASCNNRPQFAAERFGVNCSRMISHYDCKRNLRFGIKHI